VETTLAAGDKLMAHPLGEPIGWYVQIDDHEWAETEANHQVIDYHVTTTKRKKKTKRGNR
jgi:hypothetical protein